jgi:hypothetical protein
MLLYYSGPGGGDGGVFVTVHSPDPCAEFL